MLAKIDKCVKKVKQFPVEIWNIEEKKKVVANFIIFQPSGHMSAHTKILCNSDNFVKFSKPTHFYVIPIYNP